MKTSLLFMIFLLFVFIKVSLSQEAESRFGGMGVTEQSGEKMSVKDSDDNVLMEVIDEGLVGSIMIPDTNVAPLDITNKLYNLSGTLYWNGNPLEASGANWSLTGNSGTTPGTNFIGTTDNIALEVHVDGTRIVKYIPKFVSTWFMPNIIAGSDLNSIPSYVTSGTISGGGGVLNENQVNDNWGTVCGGIGNRVNLVGGSIGGGNSNITGGVNSTVGGGGANNASGNYSTIGGGDDNSTAGISATVPGGMNNSAVGNYSFAAGRRAKANFSGSFVWGDATDADVASTANNQFIIRASGGVGIGQTNPSTALDVNGTLKMTGFSLPTGASMSRVLTSDASGSGTWQDLPATNPGWNLSGNAGTTPGTDFLGTTDNVALHLHVNGNRALRIEPTLNSPNMISGYDGNSVAPGKEGATIGGGGSNLNANLVTQNYGTISGGRGNQAGSWSTIGGGNQNIANSANSAISGGRLNTVSAGEATIGGGNSNTASNTNATVGGGFINTASGSSSTISGGYQNSAGGAYATIPGGMYNSAAGNYSVAAGRRAKANHEGSFVWGDATDADIASSANNQFIVRASGGVGIGTNSPSTTLDVSGTANISGTLQMGGFILPGGASNGDVLTSNASGVGTWQNSAIPSGAIVMWSGSIGSIPAGWELCDGDFGTPDLRGRFIYGCQNGEDPTGNRFTAISDSIHSHSVSGNAESFSPHVTVGSFGIPARNVNLDNHTHVVTGTTDAQSHLPPYYKLAFIMKL